MTFPEHNCRHISPSEDADGFSARMRFHQSWYRYYCLKDCRPGPNPNAHGALYGNMLTEDDARKGKNFLTTEIFECARDRFPLAAAGKKVGRLYTNMLSSQPMCFNLFGPLTKDPKLPTELFRTLPGFPADAEVKEVKIEFAPENKEAHLNDSTSHDAFVVYERPNGGKRPGNIKGFIGIETKLTEPFSQEDYDFSERYAKWMHQGPWWWKSGAECEFSNTAFNQLWRNQLLNYSMVYRKDSEYQEGYCAVVYPLGDEACYRSIESYREKLNGEGNQKLLSWPLETIAACWDSVLRNHELHEWFDAFQTRYQRLEKSERDWKHFRQMQRR